MVKCKLKKIINVILDKHVGYNINVMRQSACSEINPVTVKILLLSGIVWSSIRLSDGSNIKLFILVGWD